MPQYIFTLQNLTKTVPPKREILRNINLSFYPGAKIGMLGLNGSGKSTLLRIMSGTDTEFDGELHSIPGLSIGYLPQEPFLEETKNVREVLQESITKILDCRKRLEVIYSEYAKPDANFEELSAEQAKLESILQASDGHDIERRTEVFKDALALPSWDAKIGYLSGGEKRRVALCRLLLVSPDILLLDEPTNHLDANSVFWLEKFLSNFPGTVIAITHDRYFLDNVANWILELDRGCCIPYKGNYSEWLEAKSIRLIQESKKESSHEKAMKNELEWIRQGAKARQSKSKSRLRNFDQLQSITFQKSNETNEIYIPVGSRLGNKVIECIDLSKRYNQLILMENLSISIPRGAIVGVIGGNGVGKSTLFRMLTGEEKPDSGKIEIGETVQIAHVNQSRDNLKSEETVFQAVSNGSDVIRIGNYEVSSRNYIGRFNFKGSDQQKLVKDLSGGERGRLQLAITLKKGANVLLLDEPSNDLDVETLRSLEEALLVFPGTSIVISHDRWFLNRIATHILAYEDNSRITLFEGNYSEYQQHYKENNKPIKETRRQKKVRA